MAISSREKEVRTPEPEERREGPIAKAIEATTSKLPSDVFLWAAGGGILASIVLHATNHRERGNFVSAWVPTVLLLGVYNKLVKLHGSDQTEE